MTLARRTVQDVFQHILQSPLDRPFSSRRLERDSLDDYLQRRTSAQISIAELYHENSKLFPETASGLLAHELPRGELQRQFLRRRARTVRGDDGVPPSIPAPLRDLLSAFARQCKDFAYAVELRIVVGRELLAHDAWSDSLRLLRTLSEQEHGRLVIGVGAHGGVTVGADDAIVAVVCSFARNDVLFGRRGYRRTLLEAGHVIQAFLETAQAAGARADIVYEYADYDVDEAIGVDGVEEGCVAAIVVR